MPTVRIKASEHKVCVFCDCRAEFATVGLTIVQFCPDCRDYKGLITVEEWEDKTGEVWEDA